MFRKNNEKKPLLLDQRIQKLDEMVKDVSSLPKSKEKTVILQQIEVLQKELLLDDKIDNLNETMDGLERQLLSLKEKMKNEAKQQLQNKIDNKREVLNYQETTLLSKASENTEFTKAAFKKVQPQRSSGTETIFACFFCCGGNKSQYKEIPSYPNPTALKGKIN